MSLGGYVILRTAIIIPMAVGVSMAMAVCLMPYAQTETSGCLAVAWTQIVFILSYRYTSA